MEFCHKFQKDQTGKKQNKTNKEKKKRNKEHQPGHTNSFAQLSCTA